MEIQESLFISCFNVTKRFVVSVYFKKHLLTISENLTKKDADFCQVCTNFFKRIREKSASKVHKQRVFREIS